MNPFEVFIRDRQSPDKKLVRKEQYSAEQYLLEHKNECVGFSDSSVDKLINTLDTQELKWELEHDYYNPELMRLLECMVSKVVAGPETKGVPVPDPDKTHWFT